MLPVRLVLFGLAMITTQACNTEATEFICAESVDCGTGTCEASRHCSFVDSVCESGQRFGNSSGSESGVCVDDSVAGSTDLVVPIAKIKEGFSLPCDLTTLQLDGSGSEAFGGATVEEFTWSILREGAPDIVFTEDGDSVITPGPYRTAGTGAAPFLNLRSYAGTKAARLDLRDVVEAMFFQSGLSLLAGDHTLYLALASDGVEPVVAVDIVLREMTTNLAVMSWSVTPEVNKFNAYQKDFVIPEGLGASMQLEIYMTQGQYVWVDNIAIVYEPIVADPLVVSTNTSFETGREPWDSTWGDVGYEGLIPESLLRHSNTKVELIVTDSKGAVSTPVEVSIPVTACPPS